MARSIGVRVPLPPDQAISLFLFAAEALHHQVIRFDAERRTCEVRADFRLGALATFRVSAEASEGEAAGETRLLMLVQPGFKLLPWTGVGQSEAVAWQLVGKMQELHDPERYKRLSDAIAPPHPVAPDA